MDRGLLYIEVGESSEKGFQESGYRFCSIDDSTQRRHFIARMLESLDSGRDVVPNSFSLDVLIYDHLAARSHRAHRLSSHGMFPGTCDFILQKHIHKFYLNLVMLFTVN
jgi:hypothetical protein